ncbi:PadR family transcriptional regulator [Thermopolyspora sp. NPDC052614]|uniref:PadR family transcriptional regulator n=1 Tax=Thermopolyspora sp. NPDC052614 TaxID=3155682 RepID=UPI0034218FAD
MSIRHGLLALLSRGPRYGYQLRVEFEASIGGTWPLNIGQVYTTLSRMERDGLVAPGEQDGQGRVVYSITEAGRSELTRWFATPVAQADRPRDELVIKLALAVTAPGVDVRRIIQAQRTATMRRMQQLTRAKRVAAGGTAAKRAHHAGAGGAGVAGEPGERVGEDTQDAEGRGRAHQLVLDSLIFQAEAEQRWLDHCEALLTAPGTRSPWPAA